MTALRTFSGTHSWHHTVLNDTDAQEEGNADQIIDNIESGHCPRCERPLPEPPERPAGSRITQCRTIPICGPCGIDEAYEVEAGYMSGASCWPLGADEIDERRRRIESQAVTGVLDVDSRQLITNDGVTPVVIPNTGGWAQYGFPDEG